MLALVVVAVGLGALAARRVVALRRRSNPGPLLLATAAVVVGLVGLGITAWHSQQLRAAHVALVLGYVVTYVLTPQPRPADRRAG